MDELVNRSNKLQIYSNKKQFVGRIRKSVEQIYNTFGQKNKFYEVKYSFGRISNSFEQIKDPFGRISILL